MADRILICGDTGRHLPCPVCKGKKSHHEACPVPVLGPPDLAADQEANDG